MSFVPRSVAGVKRVMEMHHLLTFSTSCVGVLMTNGTDRLHVVGKPHDNLPQILGNPSVQKGSDTRM